MPVRLLIGPIGTGKTSRVLDIFTRFDSLRHHDDVRLVLPSLNDISYVKSLLLSRYNNAGFLGEPVRTFADFAREIAGGVRAVSDAGRHVILMRAVSNAPDSCLSGVCRTQGLLNAVGHTIRRLKSNGISPDDLSSAAGRAKRRMSDVSRRRVADLITVYGLYEKYLSEAGLLDREDIMLRAVEACSGGFGALNIPGSLIFDGFSRLTSVQCRLLEHLAQSPSEVVFTLDHDPERPEVYANVDPLFQRLKQLPNISVEHFTSERASNPNDLVHLRDNLFRSDVALVCPDGSIALLAGITPGEEIELALQEILRLIRYEGCRPGDIVLAAGRIASYASEICAALGGYGISTAPHMLPLGQSRLGRQLLETLDRPEETSVGSDPVEMLDGLVESMLRTDDDRHLRDDCAVWKAVRRIVDGMSADGIPTPDGPAVLIASAVRTGYYRSPGEESGVSLLDTSALGGRNYRAVFLLGLTDRSFTRHFIDDPIQSGTECNALNPYLPTPISDESNTPVYEQSLFYLSVCAAFERLYLCRPLSGSWGQEYEPCVYLQDVETLFSEKLRLISTDALCGGRP